jgi:hypothetical protein
MRTAWVWHGMCELAFIVSPSMDAGFLHDKSAVLMHKMTVALCTHLTVLDL